MLAAAFASYIGAFGAAFRNRLWKETWLQDLIGRDIPLTPNVDPLWVLTSDSQAAVWQNEGYWSSKKLKKSYDEIFDLLHRPILVS